MANNSLSVFNNDGLELVIDTHTGEAFASQSAVARMCDCGESKIRYFVTSQNITTKTAEIPTRTGFKTSQLLDEKGIRGAVKKYNPELLDKFAELGIRVYLHQLAGYKVSSAAVEPKTPQTYLQALKALVEAEEEKERLQQANELLTEEVKILEQTANQLSEIVDELFDHSSIIRIAKFNGVSEKLFSWHKLKAASNKLGLEVKKAPCPRYGTKNLYHHDAWRLAYPDARLPETTTLVIHKAA
jgi:hypothetical protein